MLQLPIVSAWDPIATSSGSIDPLGALRAYSAIAGFLLPGATTITTRTRYLSWICAGLRLLDENQDAPAGGQAGRARRARLLPWERLLVLATGQYGIDAELGSDDLAWSRLRGVSYVRRAIASGVRSTDYPLLSNQSGVGGVGTYWVALVNGGLVDDAPASLTARGRALADEFLEQKDFLPRDKLRRVLAGQLLTFKQADLARWGKRVNLDLTRSPSGERKALTDALLEPPAHVRLAKALGNSSQARSDGVAFPRLERRLLKLADPLSRQMSAVVLVARLFESVHAGLLDRFDRLRSTNLTGRPVPMGSAALACGDAGDLAERGQALTSVLGQGAELPAHVSSAVRQFLAAVKPALESSSGSELVVQLCRHHERVQSGKLEASRQPKQPWIVLKDRSIVVAPRFAQETLPLTRKPTEFTHPYRLESFGGMLDEIDAWESVR